MFTLYNHFERIVLYKSKIKRSIHNYTITKDHKSTEQFLATIIIKNKILIFPAF